MTRPHCGTVSTSRGGSDVEIVLFCVESDDVGGDMKCGCEVESEYGIDERSESASVGAMQNARRMCKKGRCMVVRAKKCVCVLMY